MAKPENIQRLFQPGEQMSKIRTSQKTENASAERANLANSPTAPAHRERKLRGKFVRLCAGRDEPVSSYTLDDVAIRACMEPATALDRSGAFQELELRHPLENAVRRRVAERGMRPARVGPMIRA